ncbi:MAG: peptide chain release factor aRF-1 [Candidatus Aenigmarchaeota archaeon]|nr:peptide chain release factor aRF-1 [Candidatus Aenigmarchaeota archaeon]
MADLKDRKFRRTVEQLAAIKGRHTELVTVYVPEGANLGTVVDQIREEQSTAQNIKSKQVRKNVLAALEKIVAHLRGYRKTPEKGLALFCGNVSEKEGVTDIQLFVIEPPESVKVRLYRCDQIFVIDPLKDMLEEKEIYGLIVLDKSEFTIGILKGSRIEVLKNQESIVPGKTKKGGWSANRYARIREGLLEDFLKKAGESLTEEFKDRKGVVGIIIGGPGPIKEEFADKDYLNYEIKKKVLGVVGTSYTGEIGLKEMIERSRELIAKAQAVKEADLLEKYFTELATDGLAVYGQEQTLRFLRMGNMDTLLLSEAYLRDNDAKVEQLIKEAESMGTKVELISTDSPRGQQLRELGGIGGLIRYKM